MYGQAVELCLSSEKEMGLKFCGVLTMGPQDIPTTGCCFISCNVSKNQDIITGLIVIIWVKG